MIRHEHGKWVLRTKDGAKVLGTHDTREEAEAQESAIEASKQRIIGHVPSVGPIYTDGAQTRTAHGADGKFVSGGGSAGGGKHAHLLGKTVTLGHPGGREIHGGKVIKTHEGFEHDASLVGKKVKVVDVHPSGKHVLVEHDGKRHMWPANHAHEHGPTDDTKAHAGMAGLAGGQGSKASARLQAKHSH